MLSCFEHAWQKAYDKPRGSNAFRNSTLQPHAASPLETYAMAMVDEASSTPPKIPEIVQLARAARPQRLPGPQLLDEDRGRKKKSAGSWSSSRTTLTCCCDAISRQGKLQKQRA